MKILLNSNHLLISLSLFIINFSAVAQIEFELRNKEWSEIFTQDVYDYYNNHVFNNENDYNTLIYINPDYSGSDSNGSITHPFKNLNDVNKSLSNTAYLIKRGTSQDWNNISGAIVLTGNNIMLGAYGEGEMPFATGSTVEFLGENTLIRDLYLETVRFGRTPGAPHANNGKIFNSRFSGGNELAAFGINYQIIGVEIFEKQRNGIHFIGHNPNSDSHIEIGYSHIHTINQVWTPETDQWTASGDCIQVRNFRGTYYIHNNILDKSDNGNKAVIFFNPHEYTEHVEGLVENNYVYAGFSYPDGSSGLIFKRISQHNTEKHHHVTIRNNVIIGHEFTYQGITYYSDRGVGGSQSRFTVYGNIFIDLKTPIWLGDGSSGQNLTYNNTIINTKGGGKPINQSTQQGIPFMFNNIFPDNSHSSPPQSGGNIYLNNLPGGTTVNDLFTDPANEDYRLKQGSIAINGGTWESWMEEDWTHDLSGTTVSQDNNIDIGALQFTQGSVPEPPFTINITILGSGLVTKNPDKLEYDLNESVQLTATPETGWDFTGWSGNLTGTTNPVTIVMNNDKNITATFQEITYQVQAQANPDAGGQISGTGIFTHGETVSLIATPSTGYSFVNWTENGNIVSQNPEYSFTVTENRNLTAHFFIETYSVSITADPTSGGSINGAGSYNSGENVTINAQPNAGYSFVNWTENGNVVSNNSQFSFIINTDREFTAHFIINYHNIQGEPNPQDGGSINGTGFYNYGEAATLIANPTTGFFFVSWSENGNIVSQNPEYTFTVTNDRYLVALFAEEVYILNLASSPSYGGITTGAGNYTYGSTVTAGAIPNPGYLFLSWTQDGNVISEDRFYNFQITQDLDLTANFEAIDYHIQVFSAPPEGGIAIGGGWYEYGQIVSLVAFPAGDHVFLHWIENDSIVSVNSNYTFFATSDAEITAMFLPIEQMVQIDVDSWPPGFAFIEGAGEYPPDNLVNIKATPMDEDYTFLGWTENGVFIGNKNPFTFIATQDRNITASFAYMPGKFEIQAFLSIPDAGIIYGTGNYTKGELAILQAELHSDATFIGWKNIAGQIVSRKNPYTFEVNRDMLLEAIIELKTTLPIENNPDVIVYPNPSDGRFFASINEPAELSVFNSYGVIVARRLVNSSNFQINLNELPTGIYLLRFKTESDLFTSKIIIKKTRVKH